MRRPGGHLCGLMLVCGLILAGCAPTTRGASRQAPLRYDGQTLDMVAGQTLYLEQEFGYGTFGYRPGDFRGSLWVPRSADEASADATAHFALREPVVPGGWTLTLASVRAVQASAARSGPRFDLGRRNAPVDTAGGSEYHLEVIYALTAPPSATRGRYQLSATLASRPGSTQRVGFDVRLGG